MMFRVLVVCCMDMLHTPLICMYGIKSISIRIKGANYAAVLGALGPWRWKASLAASVLHKCGIETVHKL